MTGKVKRVKVNMLLDCRVESCLLSKEFFDELGIPVDRTVDCKIGIVAQTDTRTYGPCHDITINIRGLITTTAFFIVDRLS